MHAGKRLERAPDLVTIRHYAQKQVQKLPEGCRRLTNPDPYRATFRECLEALLRLVRQTVRAHGEKAKPRRAHDAIRIPEPHD